MRNALTLLSLLALAASSHAVIHAASSGTTKVDYSFDPLLSYAFVNDSVNLPGRSSGQYIYDWPLDGTNVPESHNPYTEFLPDGSFAPVTDSTRYSGSLSGTSSGVQTGANSLSLTSEVSGSFEATPSDPSDLYLGRRYGYRYFIDVTNPDLLATHDAGFAFTLQRRSISGSVPFLYNYANFLGQYAEGNADGGVADTSNIGDSGYDVSHDTYYEGNVLSYSISGDLPIGAPRIFSVPKATLDANGVLVPGFLELEVYSSSYIGMEDDHRFTPVPEPAPLAALGLGALALLRRRRKA